MLCVSLQGKGAKTSSGAPGKNQGTSKSSALEPKVSPGTKRPAGGGKTKVCRGGKKAKREDIKDEEEEEEKPITSGGQRPKNSKRRSIASKVSYKEESDSDGEKEDKELSDEEDFQATSEEDSEDEEGGAKSMKGKGRSKAKVTNSKSTTAPKRRSSGGKTQVEDDKEGEEDDDEEGTTSNGTKRRSGRKRAGPGADEWLEVCLGKTSSWVCIDVEQGVGMPQLCSQNATAPVTYVVSVDGDGFVKDLGRKYDPTWMTSSRKRRVEQEWWEETLTPFLGPEDERDRKEEKEVRQTEAQTHTNQLNTSNCPCYAFCLFLL